MDTSNAIFYGLAMHFTSQYRREKKKLEKEIAAVQKAYAPSLKGKTGEDLQAELAAMWGESEWAEVSLEELETWQIEKKARKWGITIEPTWYETNAANHPTLDDRNRAKVSRLIKDARRENIKWWVAIITQILGTLTGIIGALIGLAAFLSRRGR